MVHGTRAFLPLVKERPAGRIANVSSLAGLLGSIGNAPYFTAKFAVRRFAEALRAELHGTGVKASVVYPGVVKMNLGASHPDYTETEQLAASRRYNSQPGITPERAASTIVRGLIKGKPRILVGPDVRAVDLLTRLLPGARDTLLHPVVVRMANRQLPEGQRTFR